VEYKPFRLVFQNATVRFHYAGAVRTSFVIVAVLLAFHMTTLSQYIQREQALRVAKDEKDKASLLQEVTKRMLNSAKSLDEERENRIRALDNSDICNPRVDQLRAGWKTSVWPQLRSYVLALAGEISQAEELLLKDSKLMARLSKQIEDLLKKGDSYALEKGFEEQKKRAEELAKPLTDLALDLALITESFPLILAVGIGVAIFWPGWRRRELLETWGHSSQSILNGGMLPKRSGSWRKTH